MIEALPCEEREKWSNHNKQVVDDQWHDLGCDTFTSTPSIVEDFGRIDYESALQDATPDDILKIVNGLLQ